MGADFPDFIRNLPAFDGPFDAFKLEAESFNVLFASYPAGTDIPPHTHATENLGLIVSGRLALTTNGCSRVFGPGDWYHLAIQQEHAAKFEEDTRIIEFWFRDQPPGGN